MLKTKGFVIAEDCVPCILNMTLNGMRVANFPENTIRKIFKDSIKEIFTNEFIWKITSAEVVELVLNKIFEETDERDIFKNLKSQSNERLLKIYSNIKEDILNTDTPILNAVKLSIMGNTIDVMVSKNPDKNLENILIKNVNELEINYSMYDKLIKFIEKSQKILIIGDNAGESVLDKLLIEILKEFYEVKIYYASRNEPALNDITFTETLKIGIDKICEVISNGVTGSLPGTVLSRCSKEFLDIFYDADLIISKGGGNFETLLNEENLPENLFFLLMCKCNVHSRIFNLPVGNGVIWQVDRKWN